jgi:hypothetical protein
MFRCFAAPISAPSGTAQWHETKAGNHKAEMVQENSVIIERFFAISLNRKSENSRNHP